ncbi:hypothetical protein [Paenibacillus oleatilyticus]|uniref:hypothetical protein n=1 Tax=Paenibacillus oleatilyticus TaxID=2594886 RepID=UPI001C1F9213|nr:hypothetical protein [Paenibacillus oleatilyticus]MBU7316157.1 hypothetical protein [Paenibacillus oleatilyticus]
MRAMGIRVASNEIYYAILEGSASEPDLFFYSKLLIPKSYKEGQALSWVRDTLLNVLREYDIGAVFIRTIEPQARLKNKIVSERARLEAIVSEASYSSGAKNQTGALATITSLIAAKSVKSAKSYLEFDSFREIEDWSELNEKHKEASLAGIAALALLGDQ